MRKINIELGTTIIITEHRLEDIYHCADQVIVMEKGRIVANDPPRKVGELLWHRKSEMFAALPTPVRVFYESEASGDCPLTVREGRTWLTWAFRNQKIRYPSAELEAPARATADPALRLKDVWFRYE